MSQVSALIAEDEALMQARLQEQLTQVWPELQIVAHAHNGSDALTLFEQHLPQVVFLDIRMPEKSGLDVAAAIGDRAHIVFVSAYDEFALKAFDAGAVDYLLKPVEPSRLALMVERVQRKLNDRPQDLSRLLASLRTQLAHEHKDYLRWIKAAVGNQLKMIAVSEVFYFQADTKYTRVVLKDTEALIRTPLKELLEQLDPDKFWQVHRSTIVNADVIKAVLREEAEKQYLLLKDRTERLTISRQFYHLFKQM